MNKNRGSAIKTFQLTVGITTFCVVTALVSFGAALHTLGRIAACPGAVDYSLQDSGGGTVGPLGVQGPYSTKVSKLEYEFADGTTKKVDHDPLFLY